MKKNFFIFAVLIFVSVSSFAGEKIKCIKETYTHPDYNGGSYTHEFYFIENFIIFPLNYAGRKYVLFFRDEETGYYYSFGEYYPTYLGYGTFSGAAYGVGDPPETLSKKVEEVLYDKNEFYLILANEFYSCYLNKKIFDSDFDCLNDFICGTMKVFSKEDLRILRNTIYAKYGYIFKSKDLNDIFSKTEWYTPKEYFNESSFSHLDDCFLEIIKLLEK